MKLKYYLRGLGIGIIITTTILMIANSGYTKELTDEEIIAHAERLGMVMKEESLFPNSKQENDSKVATDTEMMDMPDSTLDTEASTEVSEVDENSETSEVEEKVTESVKDTTEGFYHLVIPAGSMPRAICNELEENGVIESAESLRMYLGEIGYAKVIKVGEYDIPYGATNEEVYEILKDGPV